MQAKLHRWAVADPGRRFDDLFNFVYDPATLIMAFDRVAGNKGARTPGVDGLRVADADQLEGPSSSVPPQETASRSATRSIKGRTRMGDVVAATD
jgi:RNA-directed DNA polymerase